MQRHAQLVRQLQLLRQLERRPAGILVGDADSNTAASQSRCGEFRALQQADFPLHTERDGQEVRWTLAEEVRYGLGPPLTLCEALALRWLRCSTEAPHHSVFSEILDRLFAQLDARLTPEFRAVVERIDETFVADRFAHVVHDEERTILQTLAQASSERRSIDLRYCSRRGVETARRVDPHDLWEYRGGHYLIAWCHVRRRILTFAVQRIREIVPTDKTFEPRKHYCLDRYVDAHFPALESCEPQTVRLWCAPQVADYIRETRWHPTQRITSGEEGAIELEMVVDGLGEVATWVLGFGPLVRVLAPAVLVHDVRERLAAALASYGEGEQADARHPAGDA